MLNYETIQRHLEDILDYWKIAVDSEDQGIFCNMEAVRHQIGDPSYKCLLMHARQLYNYSTGAELRIEGCSAIAQQLYDSLEELYPAENGIFPALPRKGKYQNPFWKGNVSSYNHFYVVTSYARYAKAMQDETALQRAYEVWKETREAYKDGPFNERGILTYPEDKKWGKSGNVLLHHYESLVNLYDGSSIIKEEGQRQQFQQEILGFLQDAENQFYKKLYDSETATTPEQLAEDLTVKKEGHSATLGHPMEWWGFLYEAELLTGRKNHFIREEGLNLLNRNLERGLAQSGCFRSQIFFEDGHIPGKTDFWTQIEAILTASYGWKCLKDPKYLESARKMWDFYDRFMLDKIHGGIYKAVADDGAILDIQKGDMWKCDHHALRVCERIIKYKLLED